MFTQQPKNKENSSNAIFIFIGLIIIAFIGSSFMFGAVYGVMAIAEIAIGY